MTRRVAARDFQRGGGNVRGDDSRVGQFVRQRDCDAAGAGADIRDEEFSVTARAIRRPAATPRRSSATSITCSVSGRGIRTSGVTSKSRPQNS